uniref:Uncharacterized protein n=1 Tax=Rhodosorus marinus TaxID=101924 RepID=A0A7S3EG71_9RHOD|mmetsp:Transcript_31592/g.122338  ORF Transcript_31592/g.122338 Transcript_31592/m.122338 type:complete len:103 (+) Transcript_31592:172-480(+)
MRSITPSIFRIRLLSLSIPCLQPSAESSPLKLSDDLQSMIDATDKIAVDEDMPVEASEEDEASDDEYYYEYDDVGEDLDEDNYADENEGDEVEEATGGDEEL